MAKLSPLETACFWSRVTVLEDNDCWEWREHTDNGYGRFRGARAPRVAYEFAKGPIPDGMLVRHTCDNPRCCNPFHLILGTNSDNMQDALARGRFAIGPRHGNTRLTQEQADYIRQNPDGLTGKALAAQFGIAQSTVSYIRSGRSWKHSSNGANNDQA